MLYHAVPSRSITGHWMLEELGAPYEIEPLSIEAEDHKQPEYLAVNPMGRVPALRHGGIVVTETAAICAYLAEAFPEAGLNVPVGSADRGGYLRWLFFAPLQDVAEVLEYWARQEARPAWQRLFGEDQKIMAAKAAESRGSA
jgi:glutathione S-transferase